MSHLTTPSCIIGLEQSNGKRWQQGDYHYGRLKKIRHLFLVEGKNQRQIALTLGISRNTVNKYCNGNIYPGIRADYHRDTSVVTPDVIRFILQCLQEDALELNPKQHLIDIYKKMLTERITKRFMSIFYFQKCQTQDYTP